MRWHTKQSMFNKAVRGLARQEWKPCRRSDNRCRYRYRGKACAIGQLIPDEKYARSLEGNSADNEDVLMAANIPRRLGAFAAALQACHDNFEDYSWMRMREVFRDFANRHRLVWPKGVK